MNNCIDERLINYNRPRTAINRSEYGRKGAPLTRKQKSDGIVMRGLRIAAAIFLLFLSTFGGEEARKADINVGKVVKNGLVYVGVMLALWLTLVVLGNVVNAVTLLPTWSLIVIFALAVLAAAGVKSK
jgi:hypothetical protein